MVKKIKQGIIFNVGVSLGQRRKSDLGRKREVVRPSGAFV